MTLDLRSIATLLKTFTTTHHLNSGHQLHSLFLKSGHLPSLFASNTLLQFYSRCSPNPNDTRKLFDSMPHRNLFSFNTLITSYLNSNDTPTSISLFRSYPEKDSYSWFSIITGLVKCGDLESARELFDEMPDKDVKALNSLILGYLRNGKALEAFLLYKRVGLDDKFLLTTVVSGCADHRAYELGRQIHARIVVRQVEVDSFLGSALVDMYGKCEDLDNACRILDLMESPDEFSLSACVSGYSDYGRVEDARRIFDRRENPSVVLWNSMINGYVLNGQGDEAFDLFIKMRREGVLVDSSTITSILKACVSFGFLEIVKMIHACGLKHGIVKDVVVASALLDTYSKCGAWEDACRTFSEVRDRDTVLLNSMITVYSNCGMTEEASRVFDSIPNKSLISWNSMIVGYTQNSCATKALDLFVQMHRLNLRLEKEALASAISASASICALGLGEQLFSLSTITGLESDLIISTSVINLYCKCGKVANGWRLFNWTTKSDKALWNSMILGYASNGNGSEMLDLFESMRSANVAPNEATFTAVLSGCCHSGLVQEGLEWFHRMKEEYGIEPTVEHYSSVINLLVRAGQIEEAIKFIDTMSFEADEGMLTSVLDGCKARGDEYISSKVVERLIKLDPRQPGSFVQISNMYGTHGKWEESERIRQMMQEKRIRKDPGFSWIDN